jgi:hypothetical protein
MSEIKFTTGNFALNIKGELNADSRQEALDAGLTYIVQRDVATKVYRDLAGEGEKSTLPKGFERDSIEYNSDNAEAMRAAAEKELSEYGSFTVTVEEHVKGETSTEPGVMAKALWEKAKDDATLRGNLGVATDASDDDGVEAARKFLASLRPAKVKKA